MKVPKEYYDEIFPFSDHWGVPSRCGLKIRHKDGKTYVIVTELYQENSGTSITYAGPELKEQVCNAKGLNPDSVVYIECAPDTNSKLSFYDEEYYEVEFGCDLQHNRYRQLTPDEVRHIVDA